MWPFSKNLEDVLYKGTSVKVHGVKFRIKKIDPTSYLDGSKTMLQEFDLYKMKGDASTPQSPNFNKLKEHYKDVFLAAVLWPKLKRKSNEEDPSEGIPVEHLFTEWDLAQDLYTEIISLTYGKKKFQQLNLLAKKSLK